MRVGVVAGFVAGVWVANVAHQRTRELNQQLNARLDQVVRRSAREAVVGKAKGALGQGVDQLRTRVADKLGGPGVLNPLSAPSRLAERERAASPRTDYSSSR